MKWIPFELHTHTFHSDGLHSLQEMAEEAVRLGIEGIALTDHNTMTGLEDRDAVQSSTGITIIRGIEWTTFYGHMVTIGINEYADWRDLGQADIHKGIERVHNQQGIVGVAHPFYVGSPMCTGCHWEYVIQDWNDIDYIEVWSGLFPSIRNINARAFELWTQKLDEGYRISATSGRDWHHSEDINPIISCTYIKIKDSDLGNRERLAVEAIKDGKLSVSMGPLIDLHILDSNKNLFGIGDTLKPLEDSRGHVIVDLDFSVREGNWTLPEQNLRVKLVSNLGVIAELSMDSITGQKQCAIETEGLLWIRAQLHGVFHDTGTMIGFTNAIYFERE